MPKKIKSLSDSQLIADCLAADPKACLLIATDAVNGLYTNRAGEVIGEHDDFPSGADFIEHVVAAVEQARIGDVIQRLQQKRYPHS